MYLIKEFFGNSPSYLEVEVITCFVIIFSEEIKKRKILENKQKVHKYILKIKFVLWTYHYKNFTSVYIFLIWNMKGMLITRRWVIMGKIIE